MFGSTKKGAAWDTVLLAAGVLAAATTLLLLRHASNIAKPLQLLSPLADSRSWSQLLSLRDNAFLAWPSAAHNGFAQLVFGAAGLLVLGLLGGARAGLGICAAVTVTIWCLVIFGLDLPCAYYGAGFVWSLVAFEVFKSAPTRRNGALLVLVSALIVPSRQQLAPLIWLAAYFCTAPDGTTREMRLEQQLTVALSFAFSILALFWIPVAALSQYPRGARLVPISALGDAGPLFGPLPALTTMDTTALRLPLAWVSLLLALLAVALIFSAAGPGRRLAKTALTLFLCAAIDAAPWRALREIGPFAALARIVPHAGFLNLALAGLLIGMILLTLCILTLPRARLFIGAALVGALTALSWKVTYNDEALLVPDYAHRAWSELTAQPATPVETALHSPSALLLNLYGSGAFRNALDYGDHKAFRLSSLQPEIRASHAEAQVAALTDRALKTGWSSAQDGQFGDEWLFLELHKRARLHGIELKLSKERAAEFPRGLRISSAGDCSSSCLHRPEKGCTDKGYMRTLVEIPSWQGPIKLTPERLPFFGPQPEVRVYFPEVIEPGCLLIEQLGRDSYHPWSVSEINVLMRK